MTPPEPDPSGTALYTALARIVVELADQDRLRSFSLPYPRRVQLVLDRTGLYCIRRGLPPPKGVPELIEWCRDVPAGDPLFQVPDTLVDPGTTLVDAVGAMPSRSCLELASHGPQGEVEQEAVQLLAEPAVRRGPVERHRRRRLFLAQHPVITRRHRIQPSWNTAVWTSISDLYERVPASLLTDGDLELCGTCGLPYRSEGRRDGSTGVWCEGEACPADVPPETVRQAGLAKILRPSLRAFLSLPWHTEQAALSELTRAEVPYEFAGAGLGGHVVRGRVGRTWLVRAYDRRQPALLAARVREDRAAHGGPLLAVVPRWAWDAPGYRTAFAAAIGDDVAQDVVLSTPEDLPGRLTDSPKKPNGTESPDA
ncbi:hypothetical protein ACIBEA_32770 [Streptomyces sp. NPDC051555]|uniref:pPIWI_RE_Y domain-containing protein n=1 Tax=Streptomyces sp. NPDC051555 TaxID=3365657 RepID=UPI0037992E7E